MKKIVFMLGLLCALFFLVACGEMDYEQTARGIIESEEEIRENIQSDGGWMVHFDSVEEMILSDIFSTAIVRVEILDQRTERINTRLSGEAEYSIATISRALVLETFYGTIQSGEIIEIRQRGGQIGDVREIFWRNERYLEIGEDLILVLDYGLTNSNDEPLPASMPNHVQTIYHTSGFAADESLMAAARRRGGEQIELEAVHPENDLTLTLGDLMRIAEQNDRR